MTRHQEQTLRVAGVTFAPGYPSNLLDLVERIWRAPVPAEVVREPDNAHDLNAVAIHVEGRPIGHLPADLARRVAPDMDRGATWRAEVAHIAVDLDHPKRPGCEITIWRDPA